ncbi:flagellar hook assembly protein FlgD [Vitreimonas sp.]|jgi:flagellar basal-body rod modification protein FlgD|uniref:flagellar hook assembly protein FlgD n=1 Tax=Vitreimonas sp. TaxID=3069702 RepID=UPI002ED7BA47
MVDFSTINANNGVGGATTTASQSASDTASLANNFDTFLTLLTAQLQNQDPLAPMDSTQFTQQLVQFSQVEQQIRTNQQMESLVGQFQAASASAALSYLGKDAIVEADETYLAGGEANWAYVLPDGGADSVKITVRDSAGRAVYTTEDLPITEGEHLFTWNGVKTNGETAADGVYTLDIEARMDGEDVDTLVRVRETIMGVDFSGTSPSIITPSGIRTFDKIRSVLG